MAEISYPFAEESPGGGSQMVSQLQWQAMARMWGNDRIDFQLVNSSYKPASLPFYTSVQGSRTAKVEPGSAWVGGFYYTLTESTQIEVPENTGNLPRIDTVVLRADLSEGSVNLTLVQGQPATTPKEPAPVRVAGERWELVLYAIDCPAKSGAIVMRDRRKFDLPSPIAAPWNEDLIQQGLIPGTFSVDMDSNLSGGQHESFYSLDGPNITTRTLGKRREYTPDLFTVTNKPSAANRNGFWRWVAPGTIMFSVEFENTSSQPCRAGSGVSVIGFTLPHPANNRTRQVFSGFLDNRENKNNMPNLIDITARTSPGANNNCYLHYPSPNTPAGGLNTLVLIPAKSTLTVHGTYETAALDLF